MRERETDHSLYPPDHRFSNSDSSYAVIYIHICFGLVFFFQWNLYTVYNWHKHVSYSYLLFFKHCLLSFTSGNKLGQLPPDGAPVPATPVAANALNRPAARVHTFGPRLGLLIQARYPGSLIAPRARIQSVLWNICSWFMRARPRRRIAGHTSWLRRWFQTASKQQVLAGKHMAVSWLRSFFFFNGERNHARVSLC